jgi:hypothetical protein
MSLEPMRELIKEVDMLFNTNTIPSISQFYDAAEKIGEAKKYLKGWLKVDQSQGNFHCVDNLGDIILLYRIDDKLDCIESCIYNIMHPLGRDDQENYTEQIREYLSELFSLLDEAFPKTQIVISQLILELPKNYN